MKKNILMPILLGLMLCLAGMVSAQISNSHHQKAVFDFDGDGISDPVLVETVGSNLKWHILQSKDGMRIETFGLATMGDIAVPADYNGDGFCDIAVWRPNNGGTILPPRPTQAYFWILNLRTGLSDVVAWGQSGDNPRMTQDFDGDGKADPAVVRRENGSMVWWINGSAGFTYSIPFGYQTDFAVRGDYDGDGKADLAVYRPSGDKTAPNNYIIMNSSTGQPSFIPFGKDGDILVPGDYDGDGVTDLAIFRNDASKADPTAYWWWKRSSDGAVQSFPFGLNMINEGVMDCPTPGEFDKDGASDLAVWRMKLSNEESSEFHMLLKNYGYMAFPLGMATMHMPNYEMQAVDTKYAQ
jgi:hypothetical protein